MASAERKQRRVREQLMNRTPEERFTWLLALKSGSDCILRIQDKYKVFRRMEMEFAELAELPPEEAEGFTYIDECAGLSEECGRIADEMEKDLPEETETYSRTEMMSAGQRQAHDKESGNEKPGILRWVLLGILILGIAFVVCYKIPATRGLIGRAEEFLGMNSMAVKSYRVSGTENGGWERALAVEKKMIAATKVGKKVKFGKREWIVLDHRDDSTLIIAKDPMKESVYNRTGENVNWTDSTLRKYLNDKFLSRNFYEGEQEAILDTPIPATENATYDTADAPNVSDKVFIASCEEFETYEDRLSGIGRNMRLRTPGRAMDSTAFVSALGTVVDQGFPVDESGAFVMPMMWVKTV